MLPAGFAYLGSGLSILGGLDYFRGVLQGKIKPNRITWFFWALIPLIAFVAQIKSGVRHEASLTLALAIPPILIFLASFVNKKSYWKLTKLDFLMGFLAGLGILLWQLTKQPVMAVIFSVLADLSAAVPTLIKAYLAPKTEKAGPFVFSAIGSLIVLLTVQEWRMENYLYSLYFFLLSLLLVAFIKRDRVVNVLKLNQGRFRIRKS